MISAHRLGLRPAPRQPRGRIAQVRRETPDSSTLVIRPGRGFPRDHTPGQYIGVGVSIDGRLRWRNYSLTQPPGSRALSVTVKADPNGTVSRHLAGLRPGAVIRLAAPRGEFVLPDPAPAAVLFLTAGSGITPVMSMLRTMQRRNQIRDVVHLHSAPTAADLMFSAELTGLARDHPGYRLVARTTRTQGRLDLSALDDVVPDWRERQTWVCGPAGMLTDAEAGWAAAGLPGRLHIERFSLPRAVPGSGGTVTFARSGRSATAGGTTSLLEAGESAGVAMPFGCRMGICHTCMVTLVDGRARDVRTGAGHEPGSRVQTCVSAADGDCVVDV